MERELKEARFILKDIEDGYDYQLEDAGWEQVVLPHDWAVAYPFSQSYSSGTGYLPGGTGWYRIAFELEEGDMDKYVEINFDGVYKHAKVWCNNYYLGEWANGYTAFSFDISHAVRVGKNILAVRVEHEDIADSRWYTGSGIEKPVFLRIQNKCHVVKRECFFEIIDCDENRAEICLHMAVKNDSDIEQKIEFSNYYGTENVWNGQCTIAAGETYTAKQMVMIAKPELWSVENPHLEDWKLKLMEIGGEAGEADKIISKEKSVNEETDETVIRTGIRKAEFDPDKGFFLNGKNMKIKGVCLHEDAGSFGNAVPKNVWKRRLLKLKDMGANTIRMSHNAHDVNLYELCDELGFLVIDEVFDEWEGPKNKWHIGHNVYPPKHQGYYLDYPAWHEKDIESFVKVNRNRPSVIMWSIGNEIDYPNDPYCHPSFAEMTGNNDANKPAAERMYNPYKPNAERLVPIAKELTRLVKLYDTSRPVSLAAAFPELSSKTGLFDCLDVIGYNYKEQFYEKDHARFPNQPIFGSENGHNYNQWLAVTQNDYIAGQCLWTGIDYLGESRGAFPVHGSPAGMLTTAGFEKVDYYYRKSLWSAEPVCKLATCPKGTGDRIEFRKFCWNYNEGDMIQVEVYSNLEIVELFLNDEKIGSLDGPNKDGKFVFMVSFRPGCLRAEASSKSEQKATDLLITNDSASQFVIKPCDSIYDFKADGSSVMQLEISLADSSQSPVTQWDETFTVTVEGAARLIHMDNGDLGDNTPYTANIRRSFGGKLMAYIRSTKEAGAVKVVVTDSHMRSKMVEFNTLK